MPKNCNNAQRHPQQMNFHIFFMQPIVNKMHSSCIICTVCYILESNVKLPMHLKNRFRSPHSSEVSFLAMELPPCSIISFSMKTFNALGKYTLHVEKPITHDLTTIIPLSDTRFSQLCTLLAAFHRSSPAFNRR